MKTNSFLKGILQIFIIVYFILILVKMYCWWEGMIFPITFSSNRLLKIYDKISYLPIIISSLVLVYSISNEKQKLIKITGLIFLILSNFILYMEGDFTNQWYDSDSFTINGKGLLVRQIYDSEIENTQPRNRNFRIVKKEDILYLFSIVKNADKSSMVGYSFEIKLIAHPHMLINLKQTLLDLTKPRIMGILNITPDSFYEGSRFMDLSKILAQTEKMLSAGATFLDIGGHSTRPGATPVSEDEELKRVLPVVESTHFTPYPADL